jgi:hypothetical protein
MNQTSDQPVRDQFSPDEMLRIRTHIDSVLLSAPFAHSHRCRSFLRYVVEETLSGKSSQIKERNIAVEVFGKREDYDPQAESTVRVAAGEVRRRLAQTYLVGIGDGVRISLPVGSYSPQITMAATTLPAADNQPQPSAARFPRRRVAAIALFALAVALAIFLGVRRPARPIDALWSALSGYKQPVLLVLPTPVVLEMKHPEQWSGRQPDQPLLSSEVNVRPGSYTGIGASLGAARFAEQLARHHQEFTLRSGKDVSYPDLQLGPTILLGGTTSNLGMRMTKSLRYRIVDEAEQSNIVDTLDANGQTWSVRKNLPSVTQAEGYVLITWIRKTEYGFPMLIIAGLSPADTQAGVQFITSNEALRDFEKQTRERWGEKNLQVVLHENIFEGSPEGSKVISWLAW